MSGRGGDRRASAERVEGGKTMKQDHRIRLTKLLLREAFLDLLVEKPVAKITVKELCEQANVNRATFYAHYRDLFDLHEEIERELAHTIMRSLSTTLPDQSLSVFSNEICRIIVDNERSCQAIFGEHGDPEFPLRVVETLRESSIALWRRQRPDLPEAELDRLYTFMANGCLSVIRSWVRNDMADSPPGHRPLHREDDRQRPRRPVAPRASPAYSTRASCARPAASRRRRFDLL